MSRTYVIGDIHGRADLLAMCLDAINKAAGSEPHTIITLGDYVDRGPTSRQTISLLRGTQQMNGMKLICLKGNHEDMMVEALTSSGSMDLWLGNGGRETLSSYGGSATDVSVVSDVHIQWMKNLPTIHWDVHRVYVHAAVDETKPLDQQTEAMKLWARYSKGENVGHGDRHVVHGHTPHVAGPERYSQRTNLDTFSWYTGRQVIAVFDDDTPGPPIDFIEIRSASGKM